MGMSTHPAIVRRRPRVWPGDGPAARLTEYPAGGKPIARCRKAIEAKMKTYAPRRRESAMDPTEYQAKREWLRLNPHGMRAQAVRREIRAFERELQPRGETAEEPLTTPRTLSRGYVAYGRIAPASRWAAASSTRIR